MPKLSNLSGEQQIKIYALATLEFAKFFMANKCKNEYGVDPDFSLGSGLDNIDEATYYDVLKLLVKNGPNEQKFYQDAQEVLRRNDYLPSFTDDNYEKLKKISSVRVKEIKEFLNEELERLSLIGDEVERTAINKLVNKDQQKVADNKKIDLLIQLSKSEPTRKIDLSYEKGRFLLLIKSYSDVTNDVMSAKWNNKSDVIPRLQERSNTINSIIFNNEDSLNWLKEKKLSEDDLLNLICYFYAMCYQGDIKGLNTLVKNLGEDNLQNLLHSIPKTKQEAGASRDSGAISQKGIMSIIEKRARTANKDQQDWINLQTKFEESIAPSRSLSGSSTVARGAVVVGIGGERGGSQGDGGCGR